MSSQPSAVALVEPRPCGSGGGAAAPSALAAGLTPVGGAADDLGAKLALMASAGQECQRKQKEAQRDEAKAMRVSGKCLGLMSGRGVTEGSNRGRWAS